MPSFPADPLPIVTELLIDGSWTNISSDVREEPGVQISRGRASENTRVGPSLLNLTLDNRSAAYSNRLPTALYYGKIGRNTQLRNRLRWAYDDFTRTVSATVTDTFARTVASGWGSADTGQAWSNSGGSASDYNVGSGVGTISAGVVNSSRFTVLASLSLADVDVRAEVSVPVVATGASISSGLRLRAADTSNYYYVEVDRRIDGTIRLQLVSRVAAVSTTIAGPLSKGAYLAGETWTVRGRVVGSVLQGKLWKTSDAEPAGWDLEVVTTSLPSAGPVGTRVILSSGNTNTLPVVATWDNLSVTTISTGWGTTTSGHTWTSSGGSASESTIYDGAGMISLTTVDASRRQVIDSDRTDSDLTVTVRIPVVAATDSIDLGLMSRYAGSGDYYLGTLHFHSDATFDVRIRKQVSGVFTTLAISDIVDSYAAGDSFTLRFATAGRSLKVMAWPAGTTPPTGWQTTAYDTDITAAGDVGVRANLQAANTNTLPVSPFFDDFEVNDYRFWGEVPAWPQVWDVSGNDVTAPIEAAGLMRRLGSNSRQLRSSLNRAMIGLSEGDFVPIAYWPCEDGQDATQFASALSGRLPAMVSGDFSPASYSGLAGSDPLPVLRDGQARFDLPSYTDTGIWQAQFTLMVPTSGFSANAALVVVDMLPGHATNRIVISYIHASSALRVACFDSSGTLLDSSDFPALWQRDTPYLAAITDYVLAGSHNTALSLFTTAGSNVGQATVFPDGIGAGTAGVPFRFSGYATTVSSGWSLGHVALYTANVLSSPSIGPNAQAAGGYVGELATVRMARLCREEGISFDLNGEASDAAEMGPQRSGKLLDLLFECGDVDQGILYEPRDAFGLAYRPVGSLYNQTGLTLDYAASQVFEPFAPTEDDRLIVNDATARRVNGSWSRVTTDTGPLSVQAPPDGIGTYDEDRTYNVYSDSQLESLAGWRAHVGSWDEARYPQVRVMLHAPAFSASAALTGQAAAVDVGDYLSVDNQPAWLPPDLIELLAQGYREKQRSREWEITWNCIPAGPYMVGVYGDARYDSDYTTTTEALDTTETGVDITVESGRAGWVTTASNPAEFPFDIVIGGERMTVTANTSTGASTYTLTVTRSVNGVVKSHSSGVSVHVENPGYYAY